MTNYEIEDQFQNGCVKAREKKQDRKCSLEDKVIRFLNKFPKLSLEWLHYKM